MERIRIAVPTAKDVAGHVCVLPPFAVASVIVLLRWPMPNFAAYHDLEVARRDRDVADRWCESNYAEVQAEPDGRWHISVFSDALDADVEAFGEGYMGAYKALMEKIAEKGIIGSFVVVE
jgi:hypothetical protein